MVAADTMLLSLLALGNVCLLVHVYRRWERAMQAARVMRALRGAIRREVGGRAVSATPRQVLVLQQAS